MLNVIADEVHLKNISVALFISRHVFNNYKDTLNAFDVLENCEPVSYHFQHLLQLVLALQFVLKYKTT